MFIHYTIRESHLYSPNRLKKEILARLSIEIAAALRYGYCRFCCREFSGFSLFLSLDGSIIIRSDARSQPQGQH